MVINALRQKQPSSPKMLLCLWVGKTKHGFVQQGVEHYTQRITPYYPIQQQVVKTAAHSGRNITTVLKQESQSLLRFVQAKDWVIVLDEKGKQFTSIQFATQLNTWREQSAGKVVFIIGGAYGIHAQIKQRAQVGLSLSNMTLPHQLVRLMLLEQLYRCATINHNTPYHHP